MKEFSIQLKVYPLSPMLESVYLFTADEFTFVPVPEDSEAGRCFVCDKEITIDQPGANTLGEFSVERTSVVEFRDTSGKKIRIEPALVSILPNLNTATLKIESKMRRSPFL